LAQIGLWRIPDEVVPHPMVQALHLTALAPPRATRRPRRPLLAEVAAEPAE